MVISVGIDKFIIMKTLVDRGSLVDILYWNTFKQMRIAKEEMKLYDDHVVNFSGEGIYRALYHLRRREGEQDDQDSISDNWRQHLLQHPFGTTVHQQIEDDCLHTSSSNEVLNGIGRHSHSARRS